MRGGIRWREIGGYRFGLRTSVTPMRPLFRRQYAQVVDIIDTMHGMHESVLVIR
jgi:hypothetical protein